MVGDSVSILGNSQFENSINYQIFNTTSILLSELDANHLFWNSKCVLPLLAAARVD
jgi:hypothetical protein